MPRVEFLRRDVDFHQATTSAVWPAKVTWPTLNRVTIPIDDLGLDVAAEDLESKIANYSDMDVVVRTSAVRSRTINVPLSFPIRYLQVNPRTDVSVKTSLANVFGRHSFDKALLSETANWPSWSAAYLPSEWPRADVLHIDAADELGTDWELFHSDDASVAGTAGWIAERLFAWQTRLLILHCANVKNLPFLRKMATVLISRGGPAILVDGIKSAGRKKFYDSFYEKLVHDFALDWTFYESLQQLGKRSPLSLFIGGGREEELRPSNAVEAISSQKETVPSLFPDLNMALFQDFLTSATLYTYQFHESEGYLPAAERILGMRLGAATKSVTDMMQQWLKKSERKDRFVNSTLWKDAGNNLEEMPQSNARVELGSTYHLGIQIGPKSKRVITIGAEAILEDAFRWSETQSGVWIEIAVAGIDFDVIGHPLQRVWLPKEGPTEMVYFAIRPKRPGACRLRYTIYFEQNVIQSFRMAVLTKGTRDGQSVLAKTLKMRTTQTKGLDYLAVKEFSLTGSMDTLSSASPGLSRRTLSIVTNRWEQDEVVTLKSARKYKVRLSSNLKDLAKNVLEALDKAANKGGNFPFDNNNGATEQKLHEDLLLLADNGNALFQELFDSELWTEMEKELSDPDGKIQVAHVFREKVIPWASVYDRTIQGTRDANGKLQADVCLAALPNGDGIFPVKSCGESAQCLLHQGKQSEELVCPLRFWGFRHRIEIPPRQNQGEELKAPLDQMRIVAGVHSGFNNSQTHLTNVEGLVSKSQAFPLEKEYSSAGIKSLLQKEPLHIVYFFCHARGGEADTASRQSRVVIKAPQGNEESITWQDFGGLLKGKRKWERGPLVILNGCQTANYSADAVSLFLRAFVDQLGAHGILGTENSVWNGIAAEMAELFLEGFLQGITAGEALLTARRKLLAKGNVLGLVYTLYGRDALQMARVAPKAMVARP